MSHVCLYVAARDLLKYNYLNYLNYSKVTEKDKTHKTGERRYDICGPVRQIYFTTVLAMPPFDNIYFRLSAVRKLDGFMLNCSDKKAVLEEFARVARAWWPDFCLAHLLTYRDFCCLWQCTVGRAYQSGLGTPNNALWEA